MGSPCFHRQNTWLNSKKVYRDLIQLAPWQGCASRSHFRQCYGSIGETLKQNIMSQPDDLHYSFRMQVSKKNTCNAFLHYY